MANMILAEARGAKAYAILFGSGLATRQCSHRGDCLPPLQTKSVGFAWTCQLSGGATGLPPESIVCAETICAPFICHSTSEPVVLCRHKISESPSPLKSPISTMFQLESGAI